MSIELNGNSGKMLRCTEELWDRDDSKLHIIFTFFPVNAEFPAELIQSNRNFWKVTGWRKIQNDHLRKIWTGKSIDDVIFFTENLPAADFQWAYFRLRVRIYALGLVTRFVMLWAGFER